MFYGCQPKKKNYVLMHGKSNVTKSVSVFYRRAYTQYRLSYILQNQINQDNAVLIICISCKLILAFVLFVNHYCQQVCITNLLRSTNMTVCAILSYSSLHNIFGVGALVSSIKKICWRTLCHVIILFVLINMCELWCFNCDASIENGVEESLSWDYDNDICQ